jgi:hypothetical protein
LGCQSLEVPPGALDEWSGDIGVDADEGPFWDPPRVNASKCQQPDNVPLAEQGQLRFRVQVHVEQESFVAVIIHGASVYTRVTTIDSNCRAVVRLGSMPLPIHIKWYETTENLDGLTAVKYSRRGDSVLSVGRGGIFVDWEDKCENWRIKWEKIDKRFSYHFELKSEANNPESSSIMLPILKFTDRWFASHGREFNLAHLLNNRVSQLLRFVGEKRAAVPGGTLFIVTRAGIKDAWINNWSWSLIMGYSAVEPTPEFPCTPMYSDFPQLRIPREFEVLRPAEARRVSRYERPWVI